MQWTGSTLFIPMSIISTLEKTIFWLMDNYCHTLVMLSTTILLFYYYYYHCPVTFSLRLCDIPLQQESCRFNLLTDSVFCEYITTYVGITHITIFLEATTSLQLHPRYCGRH